MSLKFLPCSMTCVRAEELEAFVERSTHVC